MHRRRGERRVASRAPSTSGTGQAGGTYTVGWEASFGFTDNFDPTGEYLGDAWGIYSNLMLRTLVGYNHVAGRRRQRRSSPTSRPSVPKPTDGGKTYTFHLKSGVKFGPPVNRAVTSEGRRSTRCSGSPTRRTAASTPSTTPSSRAGTLRGRQGEDRSPASRRPNATTIVFNADDSRPATSSTAWRCRPTAPIPAEVGKCFEGKAGEYGRDVVSTGPYMIEGSDEVDISRVRHDQARERLRRPDES